MNGLRPKIHLQIKILFLIYFPSNTILLKPRLKPNKNSNKKWRLTHWQFASGWHWQLGVFFSARLGVDHPMFKMLFGNLTARFNVCVPSHANFAMFPLFTTGGTTVRCSIQISSAFCHQLDLFDTPGRKPNVIREYLSKQTISVAVKPKFKLNQSKLT